MCRKVIHDDGVVALQSWSQALLHIIKERLSFHSAVNHTWRCHSVAAQSAHEGDRFPVAVRNPANQALAAHATTTHPHHFRIGGGLVDEDQPGRVKQAPLPHPAPTRPRHVGALLLRRPQAFFERDVMTLEEARHRRATAGNSSACASRKLSHPASSPAAPQSAPAKSPCASPTATCSRLAAWPHSFQSPDRKKPI